MISADTSSLVSYFAGDSGDDVDLIDIALADGNLVLTPTVLSEILSDPKLPKTVEALLLAIPVVELTEGYWIRTGHLRRKVLSKGKKARLADSLIAQTCIDHHLMLITRDRDFLAFEKSSALSVTVKVSY